MNEIIDVLSKNEFNILVVAFGKFYRSVTIRTFITALFYKVFDPNVIFWNKKYPLSNFLVFELFMVA